MKDKWIYIALGVVAILIIVALVGLNMNNDSTTNTMGRLTNTTTNTTQNTPNNTTNNANTNNTNNTTSSSSQTSSNKISNILTGDVTSYAVTILVILSASAFAAVLLTKRKETYH